jgi:hypothetical protein
MAEENEPSITVSGLRKLAEAANKCGAKRYAEAYRIVADRLEKLARAEVTRTVRPEGRIV